MYQVDGLDLQRLDEAFGLGIVVGGFQAGPSSRRTHALRAACGKPRRHIANLDPSEGYSPLAAARLE